MAPSGVDGAFFLCIFYAFPTIYYFIIVGETELLIFYIMVYYSIPTISFIGVSNLKACFLCREGNAFSPVVGFFIYTSPSEVCKM